MGGPGQDHEERMSTEQKANGEVISSGGRRLPRPGKWAAVVLGALACAGLLAAAGIAYAGYGYSQKYEDKILPGAVVAGVDVGGMTKHQALKAVRAVIRPELSRVVEVTYRDRTWTVRPEDLGARSNARAAVRSALAESASASFLEKTRMGVLGHELSFEEDVALRYPRKGAKAFVDELAARINQEPQNAQLDYSTGWVEIARESAGRSVNVGKSVDALMHALKNGGEDSGLDVTTLEPEVTADSYDQVLLTRIGENKLYLYQDGEITHSWVVATGLPEYPTPTGLYSLTEKRYMPTWVNPVPDTWGASMPESIPPGPNNPLGLRALNWSAPAIRFHGTSATYSLGFNASHGCVRMSNEAVIQLYDMIEVGTPIVSVQAGPNRPLYSSPSIDPNPVPPAENDDA
jgi:lipoprotein-anchoring transpeptidase ErfK/SrfK